MTFDRAGVEATIIAANPGIAPDHLEQVWLATLAYSYGLHVLLAAVYVWLGWKVLRRRQWARITLTFVLVLSACASVISAMAGTMYLWAVIVSDLTFLLGIVLLWAPSATRAYFRPERLGAEPATPEPPEKRRTWIVVVVWAVTSTLAAGVLLAIQPAVGLSMEILSLVMLAPGLGALACLLTVRTHLPPASPRVSGGRFAVAVGLSFVAVASYFVVISIARGEPPRIPAEVAGMPLVAVILAQALGALTEEIGFRGVLFDALRSWLSRPVTAVVVGIGFGFWHVQYFALPPVQHAAFILGAVALTVTMAYVMAGSFWQRMVVCTIIHLGANLALTFTGGDQVPMTVFGLANLAACLIVTPLAFLVGHGCEGAVRPDRS